MKTNNDYFVSEHFIYGQVRKVRSTDDPTRFSYTDSEPSHAWTTANEKNFNYGEWVGVIANHKALEKEAKKRVKTKTYEVTIRVTVPDDGTVMDDVTDWDWHELFEDARGWVGHAEYVSHVDVTPKPGNPSLDVGDFTVVRSFGPYSTVYVYGAGDPQGYFDEDHARSFVGRADLTDTAYAALVFFQEEGELG